jgi:hypothetical protein
VTIPNVIVHGGQQMYFFESFVDGPDGQLAKFTCAYCGGGDYVLSHVPGLYQLANDAEDSIWSDSSDDFERLIPGEQCCGSVPDQLSEPVPEPGTFVLLAIALLLAVFFRRTLRYS